LAKDNNGSGSAAGWIIGIVLILALLVSKTKQNDTGSSSSGNNRPSYESNEDKVRRVYDSQGIKHDDRMIREDTKAIEQLAREFGK